MSGQAAHRNRSVYARVADQQVAQLADGGSLLGQEPLDERREARPVLDLHPVAATREHV